MQTQTQAQTDTPTQTQNTKHTRESNIAMSLGISSGHWARLIRAAMAVITLPAVFRASAD